MTDWAGWQASWDRQQEAYLPDREERFAAMLDAVAALVGTDEPRVLDLACGPASITGRVLARWPGARVVGVDVDPVLLAIARGVHGGDSRVSFSTADLRDADWVDAVGTEPFDAVLTATALHWLPEEILGRLYVDLARLLTTGAVLCNADHMPLSGAPRLAAAVNEATTALQRAALDTGDALDWDGWWVAVGADRDLAPLLAERAELFGGEAHPAEFTPPAAWHVGRLRHAGFAEAAVIWRNRADAVVAAVR